jgi:gas vesicle protein
MNNDRVYYSHDAEMHAMRDRTVLALVFLTFGLGIGAAMALLFAPSSGKKIRHDLAKSVEAGLNDGREAVEPVVKRVEEELAELRENVEERLKQS